MSGEERKWTRPGRRQAPTQLPTGQLHAGLQQTGPHVAVYGKTPCAPTADRPPHRCPWDGSVQAYRSCRTQATGGSNRSRVCNLTSLLQDKLGHPENRRPATK